MERLSALLDLARVLHVDVEALTGRPWRYAPNGSELAGGLVDVRRALTSYTALLGREPVGPPELPELRARVAETHRLFQAALYDDVISLLPGVLSAVDSLPSRRNGPRRESLLTYVSAYVVAAKLVTKLGAGDLAILAADRAVNAAEDAESLLARGMAGYQQTRAVGRPGHDGCTRQRAVRSAPCAWRYARRGGLQGPRPRAGGRQRHRTTGRPALDGSRMA